MNLSENILEFNVHAKDNTVYRKAVNVKELWFGRHCSRDIKATRKRLDEKRAKDYMVYDNPNICKTSRYLLTNEGVMEVQGPHTSGEVEFVAIVDRGGVLISVGSDHNDRSLLSMWTESLGKIFDTDKSKQMCPAVVAKDAWLYEDVRDHWDSLNLRSYVTLSKERIPYQNFTLSDLVEIGYHFRTNPGLKKEGVVLFGGSSGVLPTVPPEVCRKYFPPDFHFEVHDPVLNRTISHSYLIRCI